MTNTLGICKLFVIVFFFPSLQDIEESESEKGMYASFYCLLIIFLTGNS